jgi:hypothetical protein
MILSLWVYKFYNFIYFSFLSFSLFKKIILKKMPPIEAINQVSNNKTNPPMQSATIEILQQAIDLICTLRDEQYTLSSKVMPAGTIGKHIRYNNY